MTPTTLPTPTPVPEAGTKTPRKRPTECISWRWHGNLGDDMIWGAQEEMFGNRFELGQYVDQAEAVIVGGGTFITPAPEHPGLLEMSKRLPTVIFGTGASDPQISGSDHIDEWTKILANCGFIGVRGPISQERIVGWGVDPNRVEWIGDSALYFAEPDAPTRPETGRLAVNLGRTWGKLYGFDEPGLIQIMIETLRQLADRGWRITLVSAWQPDDEVLEHVAENVPVEGIERWHDDYNKALEEMKKFDLMVCEKLHVGVVAACRNVPFIALNYRDKVLDFCRSINWEQFSVSTEGLNPSQVCERVDLIASKRAAYVSELNDSVRAVRARLVGALPRATAALQAR